MIRHGARGWGGGATDARANLPAKTGQGAEGKVSLCLEDALFLEHVGQVVGV